MGIVTSKPKPMKITPNALKIKRNSIKKNKEKKHFDANLALSSIESMAFKPPITMK